MPSSQMPPLPSRSARRQAPKEKPKRKFKTALKYVGIPIALLIAAAIIFIVYTLGNAGETIDQISGGDDIEVPKEQLAKEKPITILLLGLDSRPETGTLNTDVIMVASFNPTDKSATLVSLPRDAYMKVNGWQARKANAFYAAVYLDDKETALREIKPIFSEFFDVPIDYVAIVNFKTLEDIVDELGGITVDVDQDMYYVDPTDGTHIDLKAGVQLLNGDQALDFVRYRQSNNGETPASSDFERNVRQQAVINAMLGKMKSFNAVLKINGILNAIGDNIKTDIPKKQIESLIKTYATISSDKINFIPLEGVWRSPYVYLNEAGFREAQAALKRQLSMSADTDSVGSASVSNNAPPAAKSPSGKPAVSAPPPVSAPPRNASPPTVGDSVYGSGS